MVMGIKLGLDLHESSASTLSQLSGQLILNLSIVAMMSEAIIASHKPGILSAA